MMFNNILSKDELDALLSPEELEVFKAEQQEFLEHEIMLNPAHLLRALRELENRVGHLTGRVQELEHQLMLSSLPEAEVSQVADQVAVTNMFEQGRNETFVEREPELEPELESDLEPEVQPQLEREVEQEELNEEQENEQQELQDEPEVESIEETQFEPIDDEGPYIERLNEAYIENQLAYESRLEQFEGSAISELEISMLVANDPTEIGESESSYNANIIPPSKSEESSLISRSARHRERKPSIFSRLRK